MKRLIPALLLLLLVPIGAFAVDLYGGLNAYYVSLIRPADVMSIDTAGLNLADFAFGGEARIIGGPLWGSAVSVYSPGDANLPHRIDVLLDGGVGLPLGIFRAGVGIGPNFTVEMGDNVTRIFRAGANLRLTGDVLLGPVSLGVSWISKIDFNRASILDAFKNPYGQLGVALLCRL
ncbi:MAG: hypothetical protein ABFC81_06780 [Rectinema sp.]